MSLAVSAIVSAPTPENVGGLRHRPDLQKVLVSFIKIYSGCRLRQIKKFKGNKQTGRRNGQMDRLFDKTKKITAHLKLLLRS